MGPGRTVRREGSAEAGSGRGRESEARCNPRACALWALRDILAGAPGRPGTAKGELPDRGAVPREERRSGSPARSTSQGPRQTGKTNLREESRPGVRRREPERGF